VRPGLRIDVNSAAYTGSEPDTSQRPPTLSNYEFQDPDSPGRVKPPSLPHHQDQSRRTHPLAQISTYRRRGFPLARRVGPRVAGRRRRWGVHLK